MKYHTARKRLTKDEINRRLDWCKNNLEDGSWTWDISNFPSIRESANRTVFRFAEFDDWILFRLLAT